MRPGSENLANLPSPLYRLPIQPACYYQKSCLSLVVRKVASGLVVLALVTCAWVAATQFLKVNRLHMRLNDSGILRYTSMTKKYIFGFSTLQIAHVTLFLFSIFVLPVWLFDIIILRTLRKLRKFYVR
jgi:hypothetical protein